MNSLLMAIQSSSLDGGFTYSESAVQIALHVSNTIEHTDECPKRKLNDRDIYKMKFILNNHEKQFLVPLAYLGVSGCQITKS